MGLAGEAMDRARKQVTSRVPKADLDQRDVESFNSRIRDECLNINSFWSLAQARVVISDWKHDYNHHRRHSSLCYQPPARCAATCTHQ